MTEELSCLKVSFDSKTENKPTGSKWVPHNLLSSSRPLISSSTAISDLATLQKLSNFFTIFTATRWPLWKVCTDKMTEICKRSFLLQWPKRERLRKTRLDDYRWALISMHAYLCLSRHSTTFPKAPSPSVEEISSGKNNQRVFIYFVFLKLSF